MRYFGVPTCPYCKKRVNLIRTWSLKRQGEYQCPRCSGISNIYLSPLIYVFALLAVFAGGAFYFFHKFVLDDISLSTIFQVLVPFAIFFFLSLFMVYLEKPVIKKVSRAEMEKKKRGRGIDNRGVPAANAAGQTGQMFYDADEYLPKVDYRTGPLPRQMESPSGPPASVDFEKTSVVPVPRQKVSPQPGYRAPGGSRSSVSVSPEARQEPRRTVQRAQPEAAQRSRPARVPQSPGVSNSTASSGTRQAVSSSQVISSSTAPVRQTVRPVSTPESAQRPSRVVTSVDIPSVGDNFFAKYDDPEYVERRLRELNEKKNSQE